MCKVPPIVNYVLLFQLHGGIKVFYIFLIKYQLMPQ